MGRWAHAGDLSAEADQYRLRVGGARSPGGRAPRPDPLPPGGAAGRDRRPPGL